MGQTAFVHYIWGRLYVMEHGKTMCSAKTLEFEAVDDETSTVQSLRCSL